MVKHWRTNLLTLSQKADNYQIEYDNQLLHFQSFSLIMDSVVVNNLHRNPTLLLLLHFIYFTTTKFVVFLCYHVVTTWTMNFQHTCATVMIPNN